MVRALPRGWMSSSSAGRTTRAIPKSKPWPWLWSRLLLIFGIISVIISRWTACACSHMSTGLDSGASSTYPGYRSVISVHRQHPLTRGFSVGHWEESCRHTANRQQAGCVNAQIRRRTYITPASSRVHLAIITFVYSSVSMYSFRIEDTLLVPVRTCWRVRLIRSAVALELWNGLGAHSTTKI